MKHELRKINNEEYEIVIYMDYNTEFAYEPGTIPEDNTNLLDNIKGYIKEKYPDIKITLAKIMIGGMLLTSIPIAGLYLNHVQVSAYETEEDKKQSVHYSVKSGDTLWSLSQKYNTTVSAIKRANNLVADTLNVNQQLIIPKAFHTVVKGEYLSLIAKKYSTTVSAIREANKLTGDLILVDQELVIPVIMDSTNYYTVLSGDTLWSIAKKFGITVTALKTANNLNNDVINPGQKLVIPGEDVDTTVYYVKTGDSLYSIAQKYNMTAERLKQANNLTTNTINVGQKLIIPENTVKSETSTLQQKLSRLGYYTVTAFSGNYDSATVSAIKNFQADYKLNVTGKADSITVTSIDHALVKQNIVFDSENYKGVPYVWGGTTPSGFDCSGFVYYMFNKHGVSMPRQTSASLYDQGTGISRSDLMPGDLVFFAVNNTGAITHVGFYLGENQWISATTSLGIAEYSMDNSYWSKYYVGARRIY